METELASQKIVVAVLLSLHRWIYKYSEEWCLSAFQWRQFLVKKHVVGKSVLASPLHCPAFAGAFLERPSEWDFLRTFKDSEQKVSLKSIGTTWTSKARFSYGLFIKYRCLFFYLKRKRKKKKTHPKHTFNSFSLSLIYMYTYKCVWRGLQERQENSVCV